MPDPFDTRPRWGEVGIHGVHRHRAWDAVVTVDTRDVDGDEHELVVLGESDHPFARALARTLAPPYRARGVRQRGTRWAVAGRGIDVVELPALSGDELLLTVRAGERSLSLDGRPLPLEAAPVERAVAAPFESYVVRGRRLEGSLWEIVVDPL